MSCTKHGRDWLTAALDPFHDGQLELAGLPDVNGSNSFVTCLKSSQVFSAPAGTTGDWSMHVFVSPVTSLASYCSYTVQSVSQAFPGAPFQYTFQLSGAGTQGSVGPINVTTYNVASAGGNYLPFGGGGTQPLTNFPFGENSGTPCRLIAAGFEVTDVTPVLYQQGTATAYRFPYTKAEFADRVTFSNNGAPAITEDTLAQQVQSNCATSATAMAIPDSIQYAARFGAYYVAKFGSFDAIHPYTSVNNNTYYQIANNSQYAPVVGSAIIALQGMTPNRLCNGGVFFEGLNFANGALRVTTRLYYEYFPSVTTDPLLTLSTPSADYDSCALQMYSESIKHLPVCVKVGENSAGEWFKRVAKAVVGAATMLPGPLGYVAKGINYMTNASNVVQPAIEDFDGYNDVLPVVTKTRDYPAYPSNNNVVQPQSFVKTKKKIRKVKKTIVVNNTTVRPRRKRRTVVTRVTTSRRRAN